MPGNERRPEQMPEAARSLAGDTPIVRRNAVLLVDDKALTLKGPDLFDALRPAGYRPIYLGTVGGWCLDRHRRGIDRFPDVLAVLENAGYRVRVVEGEPWGGDAA